MNTPKEYAERKVEGRDGLRRSRWRREWAERKEGEGLIGREEKIGEKNGVGGKYVKM